MKAEKIDCVRFNPRKNANQLRDLVSCYRKIFAEEPWNEWKHCPSCGKKWGLSDIHLLTAINFKHCGHNVVDFWPSKRVKQDILHEITPKASCWVALFGNQIIGFGWGYPIGIIALEKKLEIEISINPSDNNNVAYIDEMGIVKEHRGRGLARRIFDLVIDDFKKAGIVNVFARTKTNPPTVLYKWFIKEGYKVIAKYNDNDGRVILARSLT